MRKTLQRKGFSFLKKAGALFFRLLLCQLFTRNKLCLFSFIQ
ncbi:hypothetical protein B4144_2585 [Bacillus atrophaeus]|nr:hypothetical protein B4144_2585 [Bacillus atrophaeus]